MGANEKHAATYHAWTPVTSFVMGAYEYDRSQIGGVSAAVSRAEFTRWLETVRAEAKAEALREAAAQYPVMLRDMVSRGSVAVWLRARANQYKEEPLSCKKQG